jgi:branched-chain amino acid transport system substrate-binding protein
LAVSVFSFLAWLGNYESLQTGGREMLSTHRSMRVVTFASLLSFALIYSDLASAQKKYDPGASNTEIKIGNIMPYSGFASAYGVIGKIEEAYFKKINDEGGINGRKINFISYDDSYSPPKTVEQARKLVESDEVLLVFNPLGTPPNTAIQNYLNTKKVPLLFAGSSASKFNDSTGSPWTVPWQLSYAAEGRIYAKYISQNYPAAKIGILYQNDAFGDELMRGLKDELGSKASSMIVAEASHKFDEPLGEANIQKLHSAKADVFLNFLGAKDAISAANAAAQTGWKGQQIIISASADLVAKSRNDQTIELVTARSFKSSDSQWQDDADYQAWSEFMTRYSPGADKNDPNTVYGYAAAQALIHVLRKCGDNLTRENVMAQAANLKNIQIGMMLPGITLNTRNGDVAPIKQARMMKLTGGVWKAFGPDYSGEDCKEPKKQCGNKCC